MSTLVGEVSKLSVSDEFCFGGGGGSEGEWWLVGLGWITPAVLVVIKAKNSNSSSLIMAAIHYHSSWANSLSVMV